MDSSHSSIINIKRIIDNYDPTSMGVNHIKYLESQTQNLEKMIVSYRVQSKNSELPPRIRARSRDLEQNAMGLLNGIKFSLSFIHYQDKELDD